MVNDPIADMLTRIRNAHMALHKEVRVPRSKMKVAIAGILKQEGYVDEVSEEGATLVLALRYYNSAPGIAGLKRISTPGRRHYVGHASIPRVQNGLGICILSTSSGVLDGENAREKKVGGELLCEIW
ncbi:30S ribosomal protein S8 [Deltaproteobacteria bacterium]|nr:30S ribosomal protein S8 [Deltaproteobacteria bacterium]